MKFLTLLAQTVRFPIPISAESACHQSATFDPVSRSTVVVFVANFVPMSTNTSSTDRWPDTKTTPLILDGLTRANVTTEFFAEIHRAADDEGLPLENISVESR